MKTATVKVHRFWQDYNQSLGTGVVLNEDNQPIFSSISMERGWRSNEVGESCIPLGVYELKLEWSEKFSKKLWEVKDVEGRSEVKFHSGNYWHDLNGCFSLGTKPVDIDGDGYIDVTKSVRTMSEFHKALEGFDKVILIVTAQENVC